MDNTGPGHISTAINDFRRARNQADLMELLARLKGESSQLLSYEEVRQKLKLHSSRERGVKDIPLDAIIGSVDRYTDFTREFLPRQEVNAERWARVKVAASGLIGLPPIEVYQIGEVYFVKDGNHRVSVARQLDAKTIQAYVTEVQSRVPLTVDVKPDELILKAEYLQFLDCTQLDKLRPKSDLTVTIPGEYKTILEHIDVHRYFMGIDQQREISPEEAVTHWYDTVYLPVVKIIRTQGIMHRFPGRTETDLYLWIAEHRAFLEEQLGWRIKTEYAASHLVEKFDTKNGTLLNRLGDSLLQIIIPDKLEGGPPPGEWRLKNLPLSNGLLFSDILVPLNGSDDGWCALEQGIEVAKREGGKLHGLHVILNGDIHQNPDALKIQAEFKTRCEASGIEGDLLLTSGGVVDNICNNAILTDLVVVNLSHPPSAQPLARLSPGFEDLIQRCPRPVVATPNTTSSLDSAILAYDGSPKAKEALYVTAYLAGRWQIPITVVSVIEGKRVTEGILEQAQDYLDRQGIQANYILKNGPVAEAILAACEDQQSDFLIAGGYGHSPIVKLVLSSTLNDLLRESVKPMLICR